MFHGCSRVIFYAVVTAVVAMDRVSLKKSVVDASEVLTAIGQIPHLEVRQPWTRMCGLLSPVSATFS